MEDGALDDAPVWSDVCTFDARAWRGSVDCVIGGFHARTCPAGGEFVVPRRAWRRKTQRALLRPPGHCRRCGARYLFLENVAGIAGATASVVDETEGPLDERAVPASWENWPTAGGMRNGSLFQRPT